MNILVTGAGGFVGAHIARGIADAVTGANVLATDLAAAPEPDVAALWAAAQQRISYHALNVCAREAVGSVLAGFAPSVVVHAAALTPTPAEAAALPRRIAVVNVEGAFTVLDLATALPGMRRVVALSSAAVFAHVRGRGLIAEAEPPDPQTLYGTTKLAVEIIAARLAARRGVPVVVARLAGVYGAMERARPTRPHTSHVHHLATARPATSVGGADATRDWIHADDAAAAVAALVASPKLRHGLYHVGGGEPIGWNRLIAAFRAAGHPLAWVGDAEADIVMTSADARPVLSTACIEAELGYRPRSIEQGVADLLRTKQAP